MLIFQYKKTGEHKMQHIVKVSIFLSIILLSGCGENVQTSLDPTVENESNSTDVIVVTTVTENNTTQSVQDDTNNTETPELVKQTNTAKEFTLKVGENFSLLYHLDKAMQLSLEKAPKGMNFFPDGTITWTPTKEQRDDYNVTVALKSRDGMVEKEQIFLHILDANISYDGVFVDPTGEKRDDADGTPLHPFTTYKDACSQLDGKTNLYIRGGTYYNPEFGLGEDSPKRYPSITGCQGSQEQPLKLQPWGNERVKFVTDALYGMKVKADVKYFVIDGFEIEGVANNITQQDVANQWWNATDTIKGSGISINGSYITVQNSVVHHMPGSGISATKAVYVTIKNNIVYDCDWWTIAGSHGIGITQAQEDADNSSAGEFYNRIENNLIFGVEQRIMSRVWAKGFATLTIDEGEAFLIQEGTQQDDTTSTSYEGNYLIANNIIAYNGKTGVINLAKNTTVQNNSYYLNGTLTRQAGFRVNKSDDVVLQNNAIVAASNKLTYSVGGDYTPYVDNNYVNGGKNSSIEGMEQVDEMLFADPTSFDFTLSDAVVQNIGVSKDVNADLQEMLQRYKIEFTPTHYVVDKVALTKAIVEARPEGSTVDYSHYDDEKSYVVVQNLPAGHPAGDEMILYTPYKYEIDE